MMHDASDAPSSGYVVRAQQRYFHHHEEEDDDEIGLRFVEGPNVDFDLSTFFCYYQELRFAHSDLSWIKRW